MPILLITTRLFPSRSNFEINSAYVKIGLGNFSKILISKSLSFKVTSQGNQLDKQIAIYQYAIKFTWMLKFSELASCWL